MNKYIAIFSLVLVGCGVPELPYVDGSPVVDAGLQDGAQSPDAGADGGEVSPDGAIDLDATRGTCNPDREPGSVSSTDCAPWASTPVCDAISNRCVAEPRQDCAACANDDQCAYGYNVNARCVFLDGDVPSNNDSACLMPCATGADPCGYLGEGGYEFGYHFQCIAFSRGDFCVPVTGGVPMCRTACGTRVGEPGC